MTFRMTIPQYTHIARYAFRRRKSIDPSVHRHLDAYA